MCEVPSTSRSRNFRSAENGSESGSPPPNPIPLQPHLAWNRLFLLEYFKNKIFIVWERPRVGVDFLIYYADRHAV